MNRNDKISNIVLSIHQVFKLDTTEMELQSGTLYEMRTNYPIVDAVGLLQDNKGVDWLVFIQVSLQAYDEHRSLYNLFHRAPKNTQIQHNISIFTHYKNLYRANCNALLFYVSPMEICGQELKS